MQRRNLLPGIELETEIASLLGWEELERVSTTYTSDVQLKGVRPGERPSKFTGYRPSHTVPSYSREIGAAWELVEIIKNHRGIDSGFKLQWNGDAWFCYFDHEDFLSAEDHVVAPTAPHAIALATLDLLLKTQVKSIENALGAKLKIDPSIPAGSGFLNLNDVLPPLNKEIPDDT